MFTRDLHHFVFGSSIEDPEDINFMCNKCSQHLLKLLMPVTEVSLLKYSHSAAHSHPEALCKWRGNKIKWHNFDCVINGQILVVYEVTILWRKTSLNSFL